VTGRVRARLRRSPRLTALAQGLRGFLRGGSVTSPKTSQAAGAVEDGVPQLRRVTFAPSSRSGYRLNLVVPTLDAARTFGGIRTAIEIFETIGDAVAERRIVSVGRARSGAAAVLPAYVQVTAGEDPAEALQLVVLDRPGAPLAVRADDVFVATYWTTAELVARIRQWQAATLGRAPDHSAYVIQDFEPGFFPWSAQWMLARGTYDASAAAIAVFNTSLLQDHFHASGISFEHEFCFEPRLLPALRSAMATPAVPRSRTIVVYGRPGIPRNAFPAIVDGLRTWRSADPNAATWTVISVGEAHPDVDLGGGAVLRSIGKLDLDAYAALLRSSAIGVSLMVSPHPSYPPLEMAHLGMLVLTNGFGAKDLSTWHTNITSVSDVAAETLAAGLSALCRRFEADPEIGAHGRSSRPDYTSDEPQFPFAPDVADLLRPGTAQGDRTQPPRSAPG
jgi:O-antigen biosynthesis protein